MKITSKALNKIREILQKSRLNGEERLPSGTWLVSRAPEIAPNAWHHVIFPPLSLEEILNIESGLHNRVPVPLRDFLLSHNGISLFGNYLNVWGQRRNWKRIGSDVWQPFDITDHNRPNERPAASPYNVVYFGSTERGDKWVYFDYSTNKKARVGKTSRYFFEPEEYWDDFDSWLLYELTQLDSE